MGEYYEGQKIFYCTEGHYGRLANRSGVDGRLLARKIRSNSKNEHER